jgi:transcriptional regulator with XRE-family HTH domain
MTLRDVAAAAGISVTYLSDLERGALSNPTLSTLLAIARVLDTTPNELLGYESGTGRLAIPAALEEFRTSIAFDSALEQDAVVQQVDRERLESEWLRLLALIRVGKLAPRDRTDYQFLFDAIRRVLGRR